MIKCPDIKQIGKKGFPLLHNSGLQSVILEMSRWQEREAASHITSILKSEKKKNKNTFA